ncbi:MAG TPA: sensor histidine kinase [Chloroflexota bacterium]
MTASTGDRQLLRLAGLAVPAVVLLLGVVPPPRGGLTAGYVLAYAGLLAALALIDRAAPDARAPLRRRLLCLAAELALAFLVVRAQGTLVRPALAYLLPVGRALVMFAGWRGVAASMASWAVYAVNVGLDVWPDRLDEYPNYFSFFLAFYVVGAVLTAAALRQAADRRRAEALYRTARELAVTEERNRLAREIHDSVAHYLTVINVQLEAAEKLATAEPARALEQVHRARRLTLESLQEVRRSVAALRAATLEELSLPRAIRKLATEFGEHTGIAVEVDVALPDDARVAPEAALALYRAAQEGLTNVQRHARASAIRLALTQEHGQLAMTVQDDGVGPPPTDDAREIGGFGVLGLRERVELLGGQVSFGPAHPEGARRGARLTVVLPVADGP